ncbi:hypothetical protein [Paraliobacillus sp. JSM ZJ581]|uniref:hypothetical protein n=1 Tax=Paraliobacillus sp. JSM ZJ581 TaxID=3342118 RepID=UPI0035A9676B
MLQKLTEQDFLVLRGPFESKRQSPKSMAVALIFTLPFQTLFLFLEDFVAEYSMYPLKEEVFSIHLTLSITLMIFPIIFVIPPIYKRYQKLQYLIVTLISQNLFGVSAYILALLVLGTVITNNINALLTFTYITLIIGVVVFITTSIRFYVLLRKGKYRKGTSKDYQRRTLESKSLLPVLIPSSIGVVYIIQFLIRNFDLYQFDKLLMCVLGIVLFYAMLFVLPEQLVLQYCKIRFDSFNYEQNGRLKPVRDEEGNIIME